MRIERDSIYDRRDVDNMSTKTPSLPPPTTTKNDTIKTHKKSTAENDFHTTYPINRNIRSMRTSHSISWPDWEKDSRELWRRMPTVRRFHVEISSSG